MPGSEELNLLPFDSDIILYIIERPPAAAVEVKEEGLLLKML